MAPKVPVQPANMVSTATLPMRRFPFAEAPSVLPGLNPNQPNARMKHPINTAEMSCPMIGLLEPSRLNLPIRGPIIIATASAVSPPTEWTTPDPAKSQYPLPKPRLLPNCESQPPPQAQLANSGYVMAPMMTEETQNVRNFQRSAQAPVTIVRAVSMNTIWNRKITITPTSYACPDRKYPVWPNKPQVLPNSESVCSEDSGLRPPKFALPAAPPIWMAKPSNQYVNRPHPYTTKFIM